jgi:hypothetical protein
MLCGVNVGLYFLTDGSGVAGASSAAFFLVPDLSTMALLWPKFCLNLLYIVNVELWSQPISYGCGVV